MDFRQEKGVTRNGYPKDGESSMRPRHGNKGVGGGRNR